jgi:plastocyanin
MHPTVRRRANKGLRVGRWLRLLWLAGPAIAAAGPLEVRVQDASGAPLPDAVVFLESPAARAAVKPMALAEIAQVARRFDPAVSVVTIGTAVHFPNRDTVRHHVYSFSPTKKFEIKLYVGTPAEPVVFDQPGIAVLGCNIHDQMAAWVLVVPTPWYGKAAADGVVRLPNVPAGSYRLRTWHASLPVGAPAADQPLQVQAGAMQLAVKLAGAAP